jgi:hypothetical protein
MEKSMNLIDRYIHEVGRHLPRKNREDIQAELQSLLVDTLEDRTSGEPTEEDMVALLEEFGDPKKVAASYYPEGQYLIGPTLYPIFRLVVAIAIAAVLGSQFLSLGIVSFLAEETFNILNFLASVTTSIPVIVGSVVIVFAILQWLDVKAVIDEKPWKPQDLPEISEVETIKAWEQIVGIVGAAVILGLLTIFPDRIGVFNLAGGEFFANPVISEYLGWISMILILSITLDSYLLWKKRWQKSTQLIKFGLNIFSIIILFLLVQGHTDWLVARGESDFFTNLHGLSENLSGIQVIGMQMFRMAFGIALIVTIIESIVMGFRLIRVYTIRDLSPLAIPIKKAGDSGSGSGG